MTEGGNHLKDSHLAWNSWVTLAPCRAPWLSGAEGWGADLNKTELRSFAGTSLSNSMAKKSAVLQPFFFSLQRNKQQLSTTMSKGKRSLSEQHGKDEKHKRKTKVNFVCLAFTLSEQQKRKGIKHGLCWLSSLFLPQKAKWFYLIRFIFVIKHSSCP